MTEAAIWSYVLAAVGITAMLLVGAKRVSGWWLALASQALWMAYALATDQPGFALTAIVYGAAAAFNGWRWVKHPPAENT